METWLVDNREQLEKCLKLRKEVFVVEQGVPEELEVDELDTLEADCRHVLLTDGGEPVATARLKRYDEQTAKLQRVAVAGSRRGQGLGRRVMEALEDEGRRIGLRYALLDAQLSARPFYEKLGYEAVSEDTFYDAGILHVRMKKTIAD